MENGVDEVREPEQVHPTTHRPEFGCVGTLNKGPHSHQRDAAFRAHEGGTARVAGAEGRLAIVPQSLTAKRPVADRAVEVEPEYLVGFRAAGVVLTNKRVGDVFTHALHGEAGRSVVTVDPVCRPS